MEQKAKGFAEWLVRVEAKVIVSSLVSREEMLNDIRGALEDVGILDTKPDIEIQAVEEK